MAGLGLAILGGALEETGKGIADRGKALREAKIKQLEQEAEFSFRQKLADQEIGAQHTENELTRSSQRDIQKMQEEGTDRRSAAAQEGENKRLDTTIGAQKDRNQEDLAVSGEIVRGADGHTYQKTTKGLVRTKDADGNPIDVATTKEADKPADQQMVEYLMGLGKTQDEALDWVKTSRSTSAEDSKLSLYKTILTATGNSEEAQAETDKVWERYRKKTEAKDGDTSKGPAGSTITYDGQGNAVSGSIGPDVKSAGGGGGPPPAKDRKVGKTTWRNQYGKTLLWTDNGWAPQQ